MAEKILVLSDGDDPRQPAVRRALELVTDDGEIEILGVVYEPMLEGYLGNAAIYEPLRRRVIDERRESVAALARAVESEGVRASYKAVWSHPLRAAVAAEVDAGGIGLVVAAPTGLHGSSGGRASGLTHSDWQLVTGCGVPLLIVKSDGMKRYRSIVAAVDPFHAHAKPAELDRDILRHAKWMRDRTGATLAAVHSYLPIEYFGADLTQLAPSDASFVDTRLTAVRALCAEAGIPAAAAKLIPGPTHTVLMDMQRRGEADVVVMGAVARGRFAELIVGNTAERVLHYGEADVLVVTPSIMQRRTLAS